MTDTFRTLIVSASVVEQCREMAAVFPAGAGMWRRQVMQGDTLYGYISTGMAPSWVIDNLPCGDNPGNLERLAAEIVAAGGTVTVEELEGMLEYVDISTDEPAVALERLGLTLGGYEE